MIYKIFSFFILAFFLLSCNGYQKSSGIQTENFVSLNKILIEGQQSGASWTNSPEEIGKHLFPAISHDGGPKRCEVNSKIKSATDCIVTILEEGPIDDEVLGEKNIIHFQTDSGHWTIVDYEYEIKRRR